MNEMKIPNLIKNWKVLLWIFVVVLAIVAISPNPNPEGFKVVYKSDNVSVEGIENINQGDIIYQINNKDITQNSFDQTYNGLVEINTNKGIKYLRVNNSKLGISVEKVSFSNLNFGLDIKGGVRAVIKPKNVTSNETLQSIISTLKTRINAFGLREANFRPMYFQDKQFVEITMAGANVEELRTLLEKQGKFEAKIPIPLQVQNGQTTLSLENDYTIQVKNNSIIVDNTEYSIVDNKTFTLENIPFKINKISNNLLNITPTVFTGQDVEIVFFTPEKNRVIPRQGYYEWLFQVQLSQKGAENFGKITQNLKTVVSPNTQQSYLNSKILLFLDGKKVNSLNIVSDLKGETVRNPSITGSAETEEAAVEEKRQLQSILKSGSLPAEIEISSFDEISPNLGSQFLSGAGIAGIVAIIAVVLVITIRYKHLKITIPVILTSLSEVVIILGASVLFGRTINLAAIAGIIAAVGTGVDSIIMILDESIEEKEFSLKEKLKRAFFIVFGAGGTTISAMLPLIAINALAGFAIFTIIGVLAGILITRPAFAEIVKVIYE